jgi:hypothetical protein
VIEPNRLHAPGERAARARVEELFARIDGLSPVGLANVVVTPRGSEDWGAMRDALDRAASTRGLGMLLGEARRATRDALLARFSSELPAGVYAIRFRESSRVEDRVGLVAAIEDAVAVAVAQDVIEPDVAQSLSEPGRSILGLPPLRLTRGSTTEPEPEGAAAASSEADWVPSARDWDAAARGVHEPASDELLPGVRGMWVAFTALAGVGGVVAALGWGLAAGEPWLGALVALAVAAVAWTLATYHSAR